MKTARVFLGLAAFAVAVFVACSDHEFVPPENSCEDDEECPEPPSSISSSSFAPGVSSPGGGLSSSNPAPGVSSSSLVSPSSPSNSSSSTAIIVSSSSVAPPVVSSSSAAPGSNCNYKSNLCGGIEFGDMITVSVNGNAPDGPACIFATAISKLGNENGQGGGLRVNGTKLAGNWNSDVNGRCGNTDWGQQTCAEALKSVAKVDGGYYIYVPDWAGDFATTGGTPTCSNAPPAPPSSSSVRSSSSVSGGGTSSARSSSSVGGGGTSSTGGTGTLSCGSVVSTGTVGQPVAKPTVTCNGSTVTGSAIQWTPATLDWNAPAAGTYTIRAGVNVGTCGGLTASCAGTLTISAPSSSSIPPVGPVPNLGRLQQGQSGVSNGTTTRYWDSCKPSCAWPGKTSANGIAKSCDINGAVIGNNTGSACPNGGTAYTCMNQAPWRMNDTVSYGFAAATTDGDCGKCFHIQFTNTAIQGKHMVVMISNIGGDVKQGAFDMMIPGGGVGIYNALSNQVSQLGGDNSNMGGQYGGFRATCGNNATCVRDKCNSVFKGDKLTDLRNGCLWYVDWFQIADNPATLVQQITCPQDLLNRYK